MVNKRMKKTLTLVGLFIIFSFLLGSVNLSALNEASYSPNKQTTVKADVQKVGSSPTFNTSVKNVNWDIQNNTQTDNYDWTNSGWVFGPKPTYSMLYGNGTPVERIDTVWFTDSINITINVPLSSITTGYPLGQVGINLDYYEFSSESGSAAGAYQPTYSINGFIGYDNQSKTWSREKATSIR